MKTITARFPSACAHCGARIRRGETAAWDRQARTIYHLACAHAREGDGFDQVVEDRMAEACGLGGRPD